MKDILFDVNAADVLFRDLNEGAVLYDTVWGALFPQDSELYMNIVIPSSDMNNISYSDKDELNLFFHSSYQPVCESFIVRLVMFDGIQYYPISDIKPGIQSEYCAFARLSFDGGLKEIEASSLPLIDIDGNFQLHVVKYYSKRIAEIYSRTLTDFAIGEADDQSAQLLSICAPGKYYRYPTTGVDVTKYVNSVVSHTDVGEVALSQFNADDKYVHEADFESKNGNLVVAFSGSVEDKYNGNIPVEDLDLTILRNADDEYIRNNVSSNDSNIIKSDVLITIPDVDSVSMVLDLTAYDNDALYLDGSIENGKSFDDAGDVVSDIRCSIITAELHEGDVLYFDYPLMGGHPFLDDIVYFKIFDDNDELLYQSPVLEDYIPGIVGMGGAFIYKKKYFRCAIILKDCVIQYVNLAVSQSNNVRFIRRSHLSDMDMTKLIILAVNQNSGIMTGHTAGNTKINNGMIMPRYGEIILEYNG